MAREELSQPHKWIRTIVGSLFPTIFIVLRNKTSPVRGNSVFSHKHISRRVLLLLGMDGNEIFRWFVLFCRAEARDSGLETDSAADQPRQPRGDCCQVSSHAEGFHSGEPPAQEAPDLPEVPRTSHTNNSQNEWMTVKNSLQKKRSSYIYVAGQFHFWGVSDTGQILLRIKLRSDFFHIRVKRVSES